MVSAERQRLGEADRPNLPLLFHGDIGAWVRARGQTARHGRETAGAS